MELRALFGNTAEIKKEVSENWHKAYGVSHLIARLALKRAEHHALASVEADIQNVQIQLSLEIASLKAEITEWIVKRPMPDSTWVHAPALHPSLVTQLAAMDVEDSQIPAKAALMVRDYLFSTVVPRLIHDEPVLNASTYRQMCKELVDEAMSLRSHRKAKIVMMRDINQ